MPAQGEPLRVHVHAATTSRRDGLANDPRQRRRFHALVLFFSRDPSDDDPMAKGGLLGLCGPVGDEPRLGKRPTSCASKRKRAEEAVAADDDACGDGEGHADAAHMSLVMPWK